MVLSNARRGSTSRARWRDTTGAAGYDGPGCRRWRTCAAVIVPTDPPTTTFIPPPRAPRATRLPAAYRQPSSARCCTVLHDRDALRRRGAVNTVPPRMAFSPVVDIHVLLDFHDAHSHCCRHHPVRPAPTAGQHADRRATMTPAYTRCHLQLPCRTVHRRLTVVLLRPQQLPLLYAT